ncbi:gliding motility-associated C-terminal domain-containing protein [Litoribacter ruber]|uniref:PKD domain-containing protein n=1 Tax=Litoribacter ruber TaxID=702568 RepID=UPI001BD9D636|nr:PKD domain-containing protein [Litoribacter ruber]MBT0810525.1 gliding motility-associated C-terminal domain-containing protein [Litoribacter ruber]
MLSYSPSIKGMALAFLIGGGMSFSQVYADKKEAQRVRLCEGETIELTASGKNASAFQWLKDGVPISDEGPFIEITENGVYEVMTINEQECSSEVSDAVIIDFLPPPNLRVLQPAVLCEGGSIDFTASIEGYDPEVFEYTVEMPSGKKLRLQDVPEVNEGGVYQIQANYKDLDCASTKQKVMVEVSDDPVHAMFDYKINGLGQKGEVLANDEVVFESHSLGDNLSYHWDFGNGRTSKLQNPPFKFDAKGQYLVTLTVTNAYGCTSTMEMPIEVNEAYLIMIPSGFTPLDRENQNFKPKMRGISSYEMLIFNTWGDLLYEMTSMEDPGWDGKVNGKLGPNGNYVYKGTFTTVDGKQVTRSGVFTLIR